MTDLVADNKENLPSSSNPFDEDEIVDLIVLGLPFDCSEEKLTQYFSKYGIVKMVEVKRDRTTMVSKGFGFIRFDTLETQTAVLKDRHYIDGRPCTVKIPFSKEEIERRSEERKIHVGGVTEAISSDELRIFFSKYGEVDDVFIPQPLRHFAFVSFKGPGIASRLFGKVLILKDEKLTIGVPTPKGGRMKNHTQQQHPHLVDSAPKVSHSQDPLIEFVQQVASGDPAAVATFYANFFRNNYNPYMQHLPASYSHVSSVNPMAAMAVAHMNSAQPLPVHQPNYMPNSYYPAPFVPWNNQTWSGPRVQPLGEHNSQMQRTYLDSSSFMPTAGVSRAFIPNQCAPVVFDRNAMQNPHAVYAPTYTNIVNANYATEMPPNSVFNENQCVYTQPTVNACYSMGYANEQQPAIYQTFSDCAKNVSQFADPHGQDSENNM